MLEKPENYEEAKKIIIDSTSSDYNKQYLKTIKLKSLFVLSAGVGVAVAAGLVAGSAALAVGLLPTAGLIGLTSLLPLFARKKTMSDIRDGSYFRKHSESEIQQKANEIVDYNNDFERSREGKKR